MAHSEEEEAAGDQAGEHSSASLVLVVPLRLPPLPQLLITLPLRPSHAPGVTPGA